MPDIFDEVSIETAAPARDIFDEIEEKTSVPMALVKGLKSGVQQIGESTGTATEYIGGRLGSPTLQNIGQTVKEYSKPDEAPADIQGAIVEQPELLKNPSWWVYNVAQTGTSMLPGMATGLGVGGALAGLATKAPKVINILGKAYPLTEKLVERLVTAGAATAGGVVGGAQEGTSTYNEVLERGGTEQEAARAMEAMTTASGLLNAISFGQIMKPGKLLSLKRFLTTGATEALTEYLEEPAEIIIKKAILPNEKFTNEEAVRQLIEGVNVVPVAFVTGGASGAAGGSVQRYQMRKYARAIKNTTENGDHAKLTDEALESVADVAEKVAKERPWDKGLQASVDAINAEKGRRKGTDETQAGAPVPPPPGTPPPGQSPGAPAPTEQAPSELTTGKPLSPEFFRDVKKALSAGVDNDGQPFTQDHAREIFEAYKAKPGADPVSVAAFERILGPVEERPASGGTGEPITPPAQAEVDAGVSAPEGGTLPPQPAAPVIPEGPTPAESLSGFMAFLEESNPGIVTSTAMKNDILARHPEGARSQLADDLNKAIIAHIGNKFEKGGAVNEQVQTEAAVESPQAEAQPAAQNAVVPSPGPRFMAIRSVKDTNGNELGRVSEPYDGTREGMIKAARTLEEKMRTEFPDASDIQSRIGATDETGNLKWAISPNYANVADINTKEGRYIWGDIASKPARSEAPAPIGETSPQPGTKSFIDAKIKELGTIEKVNAFYSGKDEVSDYARTMAPKILGVEGQEQPVQSVTPSINSDLEGAGKATPLAKVKEPWMMTKDEWLDRPASENEIPTGFGGKARENIVLRRHKEAVRKALESGLPVPPAVLAEYPDLKPAPVAAPAPVTTPNVIPYDRKLNIQNLDALPRGVGARYLRVIKGEGDALIAKSWKRAVPPVIAKGEFLVDMEPGKAALAPVSEPAEILIRKFQKKDIGSKTKTLANLPEKEGYQKVYKPYGKEGKGFYYVKAAPQEAMIVDGRKVPDLRGRWAMTAVDRVETNEAQAGGGQLYSSRTRYEWAGEGRPSAADMRQLREAGFKKTGKGEFTGPVRLAEGVTPKAATKKPAPVLTPEQIAKRKALMSVPVNQAVDFIIKNGYLSLANVKAISIKDALRLNRRFFNRAPFGRIGALARVDGKLGLDEVAAEFRQYFGTDKQNPDEHLLDVLLDRGTINHPLEGATDKELGDQYHDYLANKYGATEEEIAEGLAGEGRQNVERVVIDEVASEEGLSEEEERLAAADAGEFFDEIAQKVVPAAVPKEKPAVAAAQETEEAFPEPPAALNPAERTKWWKDQHDKWAKEEKDWADLNRELAGDDFTALKFQSQRDPEKFAIVSRSTAEQGKWQVTWIDKIGPSGHFVADTADDAILLLSGAYGLKNYGPSYANVGEWKVVESSKPTPGPDTQARIQAVLDKVNALPENKPVTPRAKEEIARLIQEADAEKTTPKGEFETAALPGMSEAEAFSLVNPETEIGTLESKKNMTPTAGMFEEAKPEAKVRDINNTAVLDAKHTLKNPIKGKTGSEIIGYQWVSQLEDGMYGDRRVSDWSAAQTSEPTGRQIVHLFWVKSPAGDVQIMGVNAANNALGIPTQKLYSLAKVEQDRQAQEKDYWDSNEQKILKSAAESSAEASQRWRKANNPANGLWGTYEERVKKYDEAFERTKLLEKNGRFVRTGDTDAISNLTERGWKEPAAKGEPVRPLRMDGTPRPERKVAANLPGYDSLPQATKDKFEAAYSSKNTEKLREYLDPANKNLRAEFENRAGVKLPKTISGTDAVVKEWAKVVPSPNTEEGGKLESFGEKIGGSRADTAERGYTMTGKEKKEETGPVWRKKYVAMEKLDGTGWTIGKVGDKYGLSARESQKFATQEEAEAAIPLIAVADSHRIYQKEKDGPYSIFKRVGEKKLFKVVNQDFASREDAMRYMAEHAEEILNIKTTFGEEILPVPDTVQRKGPTRRTADATPEMIMEAFSPRGIEFGNWNNQEERQQLLNHAYDGLLDLSEVLNLPPKALFLNGELALAFGARGHGLSGARAHYERDYGIINLTKMSGAGSLAHEVFHAWDHYFARLDTKASSEKKANKRGDLVYDAGTPMTDYQSHGASYKSQLRAELKDAYITLMESMYKKAEQYVEDTKKADKFVATARENLRTILGEIRTDLTQDKTNYHKSKGGYSHKPIKYFEPASAEQLAEFDRLSSILVEGGDLQTKFMSTDPAPGQKALERRRRTGVFQGRSTNDTLESINAILKAARDRSGFRKEGGSLDRVRAAMNTYAERLRMFTDAQAGTEKTKKVPTSYAIEAKKMDQARVGDYWSEPHEMAARAFSAYVEDKIAEKGGQSDFLVYHAHGGILLPMIDGFVARPYPEGAERTAINGLFDTFVNEIKTRQTPKGMEMYSVDKKGGRGIITPKGVTIDESQIKPPRKQDASIATLRDLVSEDIGRGLSADAFTQVLLESPVANIEKIARVFGKEIIWLKVNDPDLLLNGVVSDDIPGKIFINVASTDPHLRVLGHELLHKMKKDYPDLYEDLRAVLTPEVRNMDGFKILLESWRSVTGMTGAVEESLAYEELFAEFSGEQFINEKFWNSIAATNPTLFEKVVRVAKRIIRRAMIAFRTTPNAISQQFFKDVVTARDILAETFSAYAEAKASGQLTAEGTSGTNYAVTSSKGTANIPPETTPKAVGGKKEPWQMTKEEYLSGGSEIDTSAAGYNFFPEPAKKLKRGEDQRVKLSDILDLPELYEKYPYLKDYPVVKKNMSGGQYGAHVPGEIHINEKTTHTDYKSSTPEQISRLKEHDIKENLTSILHEIQHEIDFNEEGFRDLTRPAHKNYSQYFNDPAEVKARRIEKITTTPSESGYTVLVKRALVARKPVPRNIIEQFKGEKWFTDEWVQEAIKSLPNPSRPPEVGGRIQYSVQKILSNPEGYKKASKGEASGTLKDKIQNEADLLLQEAVFQLSPDVTRMGVLKKFLTSPEWYDHPVFSRIVRLFVRDRNEIYHELYGHLNNLEQPQMGENTVGELALELKHKGLNWKQKMTGQASKEYQDVLKIIDEADTSNVEYSPANLKKQGYSDDTITVWKAFRESYDKALDLMTAQMREMVEQIEEEAAFKNMKPVDYSDMYQTLKGALASMGQLRGSYAPRIRQGNWAVTAIKGEGDTAQHYREHRFSHLAANRLADKLRAEGWKIRNVSEVQKLPEDVYQDLKTVSIAKAIEAAADNLAKGTHGEAIKDTALRFNEEILREVADMIKARGFRAAMIRRTPGSNVVKGYIEDPIERHAIYTNNVSRGIAKSKVAAAATQELMGTYIKGRRFGGIDPKVEPEIYSTAKDYIDEQLRNVDKTDRVIGWAKSLATLKFMGFSVRSAVVNTTSIVTTSPGAIQQYVTGGRASFMKVNRALASAGRDAAKFMAGREVGSADDMMFLKEEKAKGWDDPQYTRDMISKIGSTGNRSWAATMDGAMWMFGKTEQWNRLTTMLAAYRLARGEGKNHAESSELAKLASDKSQGIYGRATLPDVAWGRSWGAKLAQMLYTYTKFSHNYLQLLHDLGFKQHNYKAFFYTLLAPIILSGVSAWPLKDATIMPLLGMIFSVLGIKDKNEDFEKWMWDQTRKYLGQGAEIAGRYGVMGALGMDVSGSLSIGVGIPKDFWEWGGAIGGALKEGVTAWDEFKKGNYLQTAEHLLPMGLANIPKAYREATEGPTTQRGNRVWDEKGRPYKPSAGETAMRVAGFRSARQAATTERLYEAKEQAKAFNEKRSSIYEEYRAYLAKTKKDPEDHKKIREKVREFNKGIRSAHMTGEVAEITYEAMRRQAEKMRHATRQERVMMR